jgi:murein L,D-transpeptidase YafK
VLFGPEHPLAELVSAYRLRLAEGKLKKAGLLLNKSQRRLELWVGRRMVKAYRIQLGENPVGRKTRQGDSRTPEGEYFICDHKPSAYYLALWISYPNLNDARAGLEAGLITKEQVEEIAAALKEGRCPPQNTRLGGLLLLHGQLPDHTAELSRRHRARPGTLRPSFEVGDADPATVSEFYDWTDGCAGMFNPDIRELYALIPDGTPLTIVPNGPVTPPTPLPAPRTRRKTP